MSPPDASLPSDQQVTLAVDIGGTFTDIVLHTPHLHLTHKLLTTPAPDLGMIAGIRTIVERAALTPSDINLIVHGTTLATNALIQRTGAKTAFITTTGTRDILEMAFEKRYEHFDINLTLPPVLVPRHLRFEVRERVAANGKVLVPLNREEIEALALRLQAHQIEAVAIGFLHAYRYPEHEKLARDILFEYLDPKTPISISSEVSPETREYDRFSTTCANAYVQPLMRGYLERLLEQLRASGFECPLLLMTSGGGLTTVAQATRLPIRLVESGPAGGAIFASRLARDLSLQHALAFDMGGTTAKITILDTATPERTRRFEVARVYRNIKGSGLPLRIPVIELVEIGAGGGSIAHVDALDRIHVGPASAGSDPGPASYGQGGTLPTVTDANLILRRIDPQYFAAGQIQLQPAQAARALESQIGARLSTDAFWSAVGVSEIVEENMANAARVHTIEKGKDVTRYTLIAFGGAAPLHAARLAQKLGIKRVVIPADASVGSAIGFLQAPIAYEAVRGFVLPLTRCDEATVSDVWHSLHTEAIEVVNPPARGRPILETRTVEIRYLGQGHELTVAFPSNISLPAALATLRDTFEAQYEAIYGIRLADTELEVVSWNLTLSVATQEPSWSSELSPASFLNVTDSGHEVWEPALGRKTQFSVRSRHALSPEQRAIGPLLLLEAGTTTVIPFGWYAHHTLTGHLILEEV